MFEIGDKVVCVDDSRSGRSDIFYIPCGYVEAGQVYTVEVMARSPFGKRYWIVRLTGLPVLATIDGGKTYKLSGWRPERFRKLSDMQAEARERRKERQPA